MNARRSARTRSVRRAIYFSAPDMVQSTSFGLSVGIENDLISAFLVEIDFILVWGIEIDLISVKGSELTLFLCGSSKLTFWCRDIEID